MKKVFLAAVMMTAFASLSFAQTEKPAAVNKAVSQKQLKKPITASAAKSATLVTPVTKTAAKPAPTTAAQPVASKDVVMKKNGTPDKRYKASHKTGPAKKDGTPDKRFKENKKS